MAVIGITALAVFLASLLMGLTGFGFAMTGISILSLYFPLKVVIPFLFPYNVMINIFLIWRLRSHLSMSRVFPQLVFFLPGALAGSFFLEHWVDAALKIMLGMTLMIFCLWNLRQRSLAAVRPSTLWAGLSGFAGGVLGGAIYMSGPPVIMYNSVVGLDRYQFKVDLQVFFLLSNALLLVIYTCLDLFSWDSVKQTLYFSPGLVLGLAAGMLISRKISNQAFRTITMAMFFAIGITILIRAFCE